jgi:hypothetical protein
MNSLVSMGYFRARVGFADQLDSAGPEKDSKCAEGAFLFSPTNNGGRKGRAQNFPSYQVVHR